MPLKVVVVGAGIAGLSSTLGLRRAGHDVVLLERSARFDNETGAAIHVPPNAARPLLALGLDAGRARLVRFRRSVFVAGRTLEPVAGRGGGVEHGPAQVDDVYGAPWLAAHRADLHGELRRLAAAGRGEFAAAADGEGVGDGGGARGDGDGDGGGGEWGRLDARLGARVVGFNHDDASVTLADGDVVAGDLVVAADGVHSRAAAVVNGDGDDDGPLPAGEYNFCYRFLVPAADLEADPDTRAFAGEHTHGAVTHFIDDSRRVVSYTCRNHEVYNFVALFHRSNLSPQQKEDWLATVDKDKVIETFAGFHPSLLKAFAKATEFKQWPLLYRKPLRSWTKGAMVLVGDAAHPMLPFQGQGGAQSIEDGVALGIALSGATRDNLAARLAAFEAARHGRASALQVLSNAGQDEAHKVVEEAKRYIPAHEVPTNLAEAMAFNFGYDVVGDMVDRMRAVEPGFSAVPGFFVKPLATLRKPEVCASG